MALKTHMRVLDSNTEDAWIEAAFKVGFASTDLRTVNQHFGSTSALAVYAVDPERTKLLEVFQFGETEPHGEYAEESKLPPMPNAPSGSIDTDSSGTNRVDANASPVGPRPGMAGDTDSSGTNRVDVNASPVGPRPGMALDNEDKLAAKIGALEGCIAVYAQAVGASAVGQLKLRSIHPVKVNSGAHISDLLESLQDELRMGPNAWLAKAIKSQTPVDPRRFDQMEADGWEE
jgi:predicted Fe-Mo cluster-binding NifX family protein